MADRFPAETRKSPRVLMLVAPRDFFEPEYSEPHTVFAERGMDVVVATEGGKAVSSQGTTIEADIGIGDAKPAEFDGLFVVGGKGMVGFSDNAEAQELLRGFMGAGKPVALICHAPLLAAKAGLAKDRQMTGWPEIRPEMVGAGAKWTGMPVERDGDLFTAVGPEDAEPLADILARRMDGAPMLAETMLDSAAAMRKLARLWRMADDLRGPMTDEEAERWLARFEREEEGEEPSAPMPAPAPKPPKPVPKPAPARPKAPVSAPPDLEKPPLRAPKHEWNVSIELEPPRVDGAWPTVPEVQPAGFPFQADDLKDGPSIRLLFQKPETWAALREVASNPAKRGMIQSYFVPMVVLALGKGWWEINKRGKQIGNAPFGLFSSEEYKGIMDRKLALEDAQAGRAIIAQINWYVAKIVQHHLATGSPGPAERFDGYIYDALEKRMVNEAGKRQGFEQKSVPVCAYCKFKRVIKTTSPFLSETVRHQVQEEGARRRRPMYKCPTCADLLETKEQELRLKEQGVRNAEESLSDMAGRVRDGYAKLSSEPDDRELRTRLETQVAMWESYKPQVAALAKERDGLRDEIGNRRRMLSVPYTHIGCVNENCPGHNIPLTFVDWTLPFWGTPQGAEARRRMASVYGIAEEPKGQMAADEPAEPPVAERKGKTPPEWMWDIPFRCPFDGARFTPREAFGHGKLGPDGSTRLGGQFVEPPGSTVWWKPLSLEVPERPEEEAKKQRVEEMRTQTGIDTTTDSDRFLSDQNEKMYYTELADTLRQEFYRRKGIHRERTNGLEGNRTAKLEALLYDAVLEWSSVHPLHLVGYFTKRMPSTRRVLDKETGEVRNHLEIRSLSPGGAEQIVSSLIQTWFAKILEMEDGWGLLKPYLASEAMDKVPPRGYFVSVARRNSDGELEAPCNLRYAKGSPIGDKPPRGGSYQRDIYLALVEGIWDYPGAPEAKDTMAPVPTERGDALAKGTSRLDEMDYHNSHKIVFDSSTSLAEGSPVLVRALFMPRHTAWIPVKRVMHLRKDLADPEDDMAGIMDVVGRLADNREEDVRMFARWRKALRQLGMPEQVKKFDEDLRRRMEEKDMKRSSASLAADAKDPLSAYRGKREFGETPEPEGKGEKGGNRHRFVIQLHHAKKAGDHYDLRLENDEGALSSWSVPKHRLPKGKEKLLAVRTEDHPVEYLKFKGEIPAGEYGAGTMEIHDSGTYEEIEAGKTKIVFRLKGKKEKGTYRLFRAGEGKQWMIMEGAGDKKASGAPPLSKTAAHSGAMLALMAPPAIARRMRKAKMVEDGDIADSLHMTLLYLGKAADLGKETLESVRRAAERVCARHEPLEMSVSGAGTFTPEEDGTPVYVVPNAKGLSALQADLENAIGSIVDLPSEHGWVPHMTVCYCHDGEPELPDLSEKLEWTADKVRLQAGDERIADIPIGRKGRRGGGEPPLSKRAGSGSGAPADDDELELALIGPETIPLSRRETYQ